VGERRRSGLASCAALVLVVASCAYPPAVLDTGPYAPLEPSQAALAEPSSERVRWGGTIAEVHPDQGETCLDVIAHPLDTQARPRPTDESLGRFRACAPGFYDPGIYAAGRRVTVVGANVDRYRAKVGEYELDVPLVAAEVLYLWPELPPIYPYSPYPYPYPYFGPAWGWGFGFGWPYSYGWGGPYWGRPYYGFSGRLSPPPPRKLN
jgi:outer membrane lipoprotein